MQIAKKVCQFPHTAENTLQASCCDTTLNLFLRMRYLGRGTILVWMCLLQHFCAATPNEQRAFNGSLNEASGQFGKYHTMFWRRSKRTSDSLRRTILRDSILSNAKIIPIERSNKLKALPEKQRINLTACQQSPTRGGGNRPCFFALLANSKSLCRSNAVERCFPPVIKQPTGAYFGSFNKCPISTQWEIV